MVNPILCKELGWLQFCFSWKPFGKVGYAVFKALGGQLGIQIYGKDFGTEIAISITQLISCNGMCHKVCANCEP